MLLTKNAKTSIPFPAWKADLIGFLVSQRLSENTKVKLTNFDSLP
jgi:hypothetical protein